MKIRQRVRAVVTAAVGVSLLLVPLEASAADPEAPGWVDPIAGFKGSPDWLAHGCDETGTYPTAGVVHMGIRLDAAPGTKVRSIGDGDVAFRSYIGSKDEVLQVRHEAANGTVFWAVYGHVNASGFDPGRNDVAIKAGDLLGTVRDRPAGDTVVDHLNFGIWESLGYKRGEWGTRDCEPGEPPVGPFQREFREPIPFLKANPGTYVDPVDPSPTPPPPTPDPDPTPTNTFVDDDGSIFEGNHEWMAANGITRGCNPPLNNRYCGDDDVTRGQMAAFLNRALTLEPASDDAFRDDDSSVFEDDIQALAAAGITAGCNPPRNNEFCPDDLVTRGQMAAFLTRALSLPASSADAFGDDDDSIFERDIQALAAAGITRGCNPPTNNRFCPDDPVTRSQMAAFLERALG